MKCLVTWGRTFPGRAASIAEARSFVAALLVGWPVVDDARLVVSELATNAVRHTASGHDGGEFDVYVCFASDRVRVSVRDGGSKCLPILLLDADGREDESGRGLFLVRGMSAGWGVDDHPGGRVVWAELLRNPTC